MMSWKSLQGTFVISLYCVITKSLAIRLFHALYDMPCIILHAIRFVSCFMRYALYHASCDMLCIMFYTIRLFHALHAKSLFYAMAWLWDIYRRLYS